MANTEWQIKKGLLQWVPDGLTNCNVDGHWSLELDLEDDCANASFMAIPLDGDGDARGATLALEVELALQNLQLVASGDVFIEATVGSHAGGRTGKARVLKGIIIKWDF